MSLRPTEVVARARAKQVWNLAHGVVWLTVAEILIVTEDGLGLRVCLN